MMPGPSTPCVLVVDDDKRLADALAAVLNGHGFHTITAYSGSDAIVAALKSRPDFILMDVMMKGIDGVDAAIAICETLPNCRIVLMSGAESALQMEKSSRRGHHFEFFMKPITASSLVDMIRS